MNTRSKSLENRFNNWQLVPKRRDEKNTFTYHSAIRHLKKNYANPKSGVSFGGISRIYDYYNKVDRLLFDLQKEKEKAVQEKLIKVKHVKKGKPIGLIL